MSVLAYIVSRNLPPEPAATQALAYILGHPKACDALVGLLGESYRDLTPCRVEAEAMHNGARPDLTVCDSTGTPRIFVENKFWAGLTDAQPVTYLNGLPTNVPAALLFVVPEERLSNIWHELKARCTAADVRLAPDFVRPPSMVSAVVAVVDDNRKLAVTSWKRVLDSIEHACPDIRPDVQQLRGLTERMDSEAFLPVRPDELTDGNIPRRMMNYADLVESVVAELKDRGIADTESLKTSHSYYTTGRYLRMPRRFGLWLGVEFEVWRDAGITPLWWMLQDNRYPDFYRAQELWPRVPTMFSDVQVYHHWLYIPIRLKAGAERDQVVKHAADQMELIANELLREFPG